MNMQKFFSAKNIAYLAVFLALVIVLQSFSVALQSLTVVNLNLALIPIVLGAVILGPLSGAFLGLACGVVVLIQVAMGINGFYVLIWTESPVVTTFTCLIKTTVAGLVAGYLYRIIAKKNGLAATFTAAAIVPILNTALFIVGCLCMADTIQSITPEGQNLFVFILVGIVTWNFFIELGVNLVLAPALDRVIRVAEKQMGKRKRASVEIEEAQPEAQAEPIAAQSVEQEQNGITEKSDCNVADKKL